MTPVVLTVSKYQSVSLMEVAGSIQCQSEKNFPKLQFFEVLLLPVVAILLWKQH